MEETRGLIAEFSAQVAAERAARSEDVSDARVMAEKAASHSADIEKQLWDLSRQMVVDAEGSPAPASDKLAAMQATCSDASRAAEANARALEDMDARLRDLS